MGRARVILIGGAPGVGKTTLGCALAARWGFASVTIDDLLTVAQAVTTVESHPGLHVMRRRPSLEYFTYSTLEALQADTEAQHEAVWPLVVSLVRKHAVGSPTPIVIDGWHLRPARVSALNMESVWACWIVASPQVLIEREKRNAQWLQGSPEPERMAEKFLARSLWFNELVEREAEDHGMSILRQRGDVTVAAFCDICERLSGSGWGGRAQRR